jgi:hypothetical protein
LYKLLTGAGGDIEATGIDCIAISSYFGPSSILDVFSLIVDGIEKQSTKIGPLHDMIQTQNSMLEEIMGAPRGTVS